MEIYQDKDTYNQVINTITSNLLEGSYIQVISVFNVLDTGVSISTLPQGYKRLNTIIESFQAIEYYAYLYDSVYLHRNNVSGLTEILVPVKNVIDIDFLGVTSKGKFFSNNYLINGEVVRGDEEASERSSESERALAREARRLDESKLAFKGYLTVGKFTFPRWSYTQNGITCDIKGKAGLKRNFPYLTEKEISTIIKQTEFKHHKPTKADKLIDKFKITYRNKEFYMANERVGSGAKLHTELKFHGEKVGNNTITQIRRILQEEEE